MGGIIARAPKNVSAFHLPQAQIMMLASVPRGAYNGTALARVFVQVRIVPRAMSS